MKTQSPIRKTVIAGVLASLAIVLQIAEGTLPFSAEIPGGKLGLANISTLIILYCYDRKTAFSVSVVRCVAASLLFGGVTAFIYSISGAVVSFAAMSVFKNEKVFGFSVVGVSIIGAVCHSAAQVIVGSILLSSPKLIFTYFPMLVIVSTISGSFVGMASNAGIKYIKDLV